MSKLGQLLKSEREKRELSLHEIGMSLKINPKILKAIEDGNPADFPAKTFLRGFIKSYAQYLRLDVNQALQMFQDEYGTTRPEDPQKASAAQGPSTTVPTGAPKFEGSLKRPDDAALPVSSNNRIYTIIFAILLLTLIAFVAKMMDKYQKESRVVTENVAPDETQTPSTTSTTMVLEENSEQPAGGLVTPISSTTTTSLAGSTTSSTLAATVMPTTSTVRTPSTTTTLKAIVTTTTTSPTTTTTLRPTTTTTVAPTTTTSTTVTTSTTLAKAASTEVIVEALNRVKIRFSLSGGQRWDTIELNPDQVHTFRSKTSVDLEISDGGAVNIILNGRDRGVPGTIGRPLKLKYPQ